MGSSQCGACADAGTGTGERSGAGVDRARLQAGRGPQIGARSAGTRRRGEIGGRPGQDGIEANGGRKIEKHSTLSVQWKRAELSVGRWTLGVGRLRIPVLVTAENKLERIRSALPKEGLFADKDWLFRRRHFPIREKFDDELEQLGHRLFVFQRACNQLYQLSARGKQPAWIARYLDAGKPAELIELSRQKIFREDLPRVIRPDLVLTERRLHHRRNRFGAGWNRTDCWLNQTYSALGQDMIGGESGMFDGFQKVLAKRGGHCGFKRGGHLSAGDGMAGEELSKRRTSDLDWKERRTSKIELEWRSVRGRKLRATG